MKSRSSTIRRGTRLMDAPGAGGAGVDVDGGLVDGLVDGGPVDGLVDGLKGGLVVEGWDGVPGGGQDGGIGVKRREVMEGLGGDGVRGDGIRSGHVSGSREALGGVRDGVGEGLRVGPARGRPGRQIRGGGEKPGPRP